MNSRMIKYLVFTIILMCGAGYLKASAIIKEVSDHKVDKFLPPLEVDDNEGSSQILEKFFELISTRWAGGFSTEFTRKGNHKIDAIENEFDAKLIKAETRLLELQNLINSQPEFVPYFASFYFRQIDDLKFSFDKIVDSLETYRRNIENDRNELFNSLLMVENLKMKRQELEWCKTWISEHVQPMLDGYDSWVVRLDCMIARADTFKKSLDEFYRQEEKEVQDNYEKYWCHQFTFLGNLRGESFIAQLNQIILNFSEWQLTIPVIIKVIIPDKQFHSELIGIFLFMLGVSVCAGFWLRRSIGGSFLPFLSSYLFACVGFYFLFCVVLLPSTNDIFVFTLAGFFLTMALTEASWKFRKIWTGASGVNPFVILPFIFSFIDMFISMHAPHSVILSMTLMLSLAILLWLGIVFSFSNYPSLERFLAGGIVGTASLASAIAAWLGYLYPSMLILIIAGLFVCVIYSGATFTHAIIQFSGKISERQLFVSFIFTLMVPLLWLALVLAAFRWGGQIFNADRNLQLIYTEDLFPSVSINISPELILSLALLALFIKFILNWLKHMLEVFTGARKFDSGSLSSAFLIFQYIVWTIYIIYMLNSFHIDWESIRYVLGGLSVGFGFALKELLENFVCGLILLIGKEVRPGDIVEFDNTMGIVERVNIRSTFIKTYDNAIITLPNNQVVSKDFRNWTLNGHIRRTEFMLGVAYGSNIEKVIECVLKAANDCSLVLKVKDPQVLFVDFADSALLFKVRFWIHVDNISTAPSELRKLIEKNFAANNINIPFPQMDVHFDSPVVPPKMMKASAQ